MHDICFSFNGVDTHLKFMHSNSNFFNFLAFFYAFLADFERDFPALLLLLFLHVIAFDFVTLVEIDIRDPLCQALDVRFILLL